MAAATKSESPDRKGGKQEQQYSDDESFKSGKCVGCLSNRYIDIFEQKIDLFAFETKMRHVIGDLIDPQKRRQ
jgi:hypothetical protein